MAKQIGRPQGAATKPKQEAIADPSRCGKCGSTNREPYHHKREMEYAGVDSSGKAYTHVVWRHTSCSDCGQARVDRALENRPDKK